MAFLVVKAKGLVQIPPQIRERVKFLSVAKIMIFLTDERLFSVNPDWGKPVL